MVLVIIYAHGLSNKFFFFFRFASIYLNGRKKSKDCNDLSLNSNMDSSDLNSSICSASDDVLESQLTDESPLKVTELYTFMHSILIFSSPSYKVLANLGNRAIN